MIAFDEPLAGRIRDTLDSKTCVEEKKKMFGGGGFLGFVVDWEQRFEENTPAYLQVSRAGLVLHRSEQHGNGCPGATVFVWMTGIEELQRDIIGTGYKYLRPGIETKFGDARCVQAIDPFGHRIGFNDDLKTGKAP